jgi:hypothetical protein
MTTELESKLWNRGNPLFFYGNEQKLDDLLTRAFGEVVSQYQTAVKEGGKAAAKVAAKFGSVLAALGLAEASAEVGAELSHDKTKTKIATVTFENKLAALSAYCAEAEIFPYIDCARGLVLDRDSSKFVKDWGGRGLTKSDRVDRIGQIMGLFAPRRIVPPHDENANIALDLYEKKSSLWLFSTTPDCELTAEVPILLSNVRPTSQHALIAFTKFAANYFKIEAMGLLTWSGSVVICDPVAWRLFY